MHGGRREFNEMSLVYGFLLLLMGIVVCDDVRTAEGAVLYGPDLVSMFPIDAPAAELRQWRPDPYELRNPGHAAVKRAVDEGWDSWIRSAADERCVVERGWRFNKARGLRVVRFFEEVLRYPQSTEFTNAGEPFLPLDWQYYDFIMPLFSWERQDGTRRYRYGYVEIPKKNGKSGLCSGIAGNQLVNDDEESAEVYLAATDRDQASIVYRAFRNMVRMSPYLSRELYVTDGVHNIAHVPTASFLRTLSRAVGKNEGLNISTLIFDEVHAHKTPDLWNTLRYGGDARRQPLLLGISTAGERKEGLGWTMHELARQVLEGSVVLDDFFAYIRGAAPADDWHDRRVWYKANPSLGWILSEERFAEAHAEAVTDQVKEAVFRRYKLNQWIEGATPWIAMPDWDMCAAAYGWEILAAYPCCGGLDLSSVDDTSAFRLCFKVPVADAERLGLWRPEAEAEADEDGEVERPKKPQYIDVYKGLTWAPEETAKRRQCKDGTPYLHWAARGWLEVMPGERLSHEIIGDQVEALCRKYHVQEIGFDDHNAMYLAERLDAAGIVMVKYRQGYNMSEFSKKYEASIKGHTMRHDGNPLDRWMSANAAVDVNANEEIRLNRRDSADKIDGVVAAVMAKARADLVKPKYQYEPGDIVTLGGTS